MTGISFDAFTRRAAEAVTRRTSVLALGAAALGVATTPRVAEAGKCGKKVKKKCADLEAQCFAAVADVCDGRPDEEDCLACEECCRSERACIDRETFSCLLRCFDILNI